MAENRTEATPPETAAPAAAASRGGLKAWLPLVITITLMPALAYAMTTFVLVPKLQKSLGISATARAGGEGGEAEGKKAGSGHKETVMMNKLLVNVAGTMGARYLLASVSVVGLGPNFKEKMEEHDAQLRDMGCGALATKTLADLEKPGARNLIRSELISGFNNILGEALVQEIYLTEFAIQ